MALVVITGGARSGKSTLAQRLAAARELEGAHVCVVVFGRANEFDPEFTRRIERHRAHRPASFRTIEASTSGGWLEEVPEDALLVLDCVGTLLGRVMEEAHEGVADPGGCGALGSTADEALLPGLEERCAARIDDVLDGLLERGGDAIIVTNEVGDGVVPPYASGRLFRDLIGWANRRLVTAADAAYLCVAGRIIDLSNQPMSVEWPED